MSNYDDPRWYEEPEHVQPGSHSTPSQQPASHNVFSRLLPGGDDSQRGADPAQGLPVPDRGQRIRRRLGQFIIIGTLLIIAFLAGWFGHQIYLNSIAISGQSQYYENLFQQAWTIVDQNYVDRKAVNYKDMSYQAIQAMLATLNDKGHTRFLTPADVKTENQELNGTFTGIGVYLDQDAKTKEWFLSQPPIPGSPAQKAGLKQGDIITAVNGKSTKGLDLTSISNMIRGPAGTSVSITIERPSTHQTLTFKITRAVIKVPSVAMHYIAQDHIADIEILQFSDGTSVQLKTALLQAKKMGARKIILDLRGNPGGYLDEAVNTVSEFVKSGNVLLEQDSSGNRIPVPVTGNTVDTTDPIVVLVNGDTASAAEIVTGALEDDHRAIVMGTTTYGTGTVLQQFTLSDGSAILLGTQEWLTPGGQFIRNNGIHPQITVTDPNNIILTPGEENASHMTEQQILSSGDTQLAAAIKYLESH